MSDNKKEKKNKRKEGMKVGEREEEGGEGKETWS